MRQVSVPFNANRFHPEFYLPFHCGLFLDLFKDSRDLSETTMPTERRASQNRQ